jgi:ABC-2 type transport system permease protein
MRDSIAMTGRELRHILRYPLIIVASIGLPVLMFLLFVYVFGDTVTAGLRGTGHRLSYVDYLAPGS